MARGRMLNKTVSLSLKFHLTFSEKVCYNENG